jgi:hypothetical protein
VKTLRLCLLIWLAVLLPVRGAIAAAMTCPPPAAQSETRASFGPAPHAEATQPAAHVHHPTTDDSSAHSGHDAGGPETCNLCCAFCAMTPLISSLPSVALPQGFSTISFPAFSAPAPSFLSEGQERPPRSI